MICEPVLLSDSTTYTVARVVWFPNLMSRFF